MAQKRGRDERSSGSFGSKDEKCDLSTWASDKARSWSIGGVDEGEVAEIHEEEVLSFQGTERIGK